ncbi:MAG: ATP-binding protein, partial [Magnetococcales bacterium]|nr:ATP-binding protein [Magnetococcales bacterium]
MSEDWRFIQSDFNTLPVPYPLLASKPLAEDYGRQLAFLFKPNRTFVLYPNPVPSKNDIPGLHNGGWLFLLHPPNEWSLPKLICMINRNGDFSLWRFAPFDPLSPQDGGLFHLLLRCHSLPYSMDRGLAFFNLSDKSDKSDPNPRQDHAQQHSDFDLLRMRHAHEPEGIILIKLFTPSYTYRLEIGLEMDATHPLETVTFSARRLPIDTHRGKENLRLRQVGGWQSSPAIYWDDQDSLLKFEDKNFPSPPAFSQGFSPVAAGILDALLVACGNDEPLMILDPLLKTWSKSRESLKGYATCLAMVPADCSIQSQYPMVLVGCDDMRLYLFDHEGALLQKVNFETTIDAVLCLHGEPGQWVDILVLSSYHGLQVGRICFDRTYPEEKIHQERIKIRQALLDELKQRPDPLAVLRHMLDSQSHAAQLKAILIILEDPITYASLLDPTVDGSLLDKLDDYLTAFLTHSLSRQIDKLLEKPSRNKDEDKRLDSYFHILLYMAKGVKQSRMEVRRLEGRLMLLLDEGGQLAQDAPQRETLKTLFSELQDAKRLLRKYAKQSYDSCNNQTTDPSAQGACIKLIGLVARDKLFTELTVKPTHGHGQVRAVAFCGPGNIKEKLMVFAPHGADRLQTFHMHYEELKSSPSPAKKWEFELKTKVEEPLPQVRCLLSLGEDGVLILTEDRLGYGNITSQTMVWQDIPGSSCHGLSLFPDQQRVVVCGEWLPDGYAQPSKEILMVFRILPDGMLQREEGCFLNPREEWKERCTIRETVWDDQGGLWGVTAPKGKLLYWPDAARATPLHPTPLPKVVLEMGIPQYSIQFLAGKIYCGGQDGAVRAFDLSGQLCWLNQLPGPINSVRTITTKDGYHRVAAVADREHLFLYNEKGDPKGMIFLPGTHIISLAAGTWRPDGPCHYLIGFLDGEVRLLEEVPEKFDWQEFMRPDSNIYPDVQADLWEDIINNVNSKIANMDTNLLLKWCQIPHAILEPSRFAWAAEYLILHNRILIPDWFSKLFDLLDEIQQPGSIGSNLPSRRRLRSLLLRELGRHLHRIPKELIPRLLQVGDKVLDGAFASLLANIPMEAIPVLGESNLFQLLGKGVHKAAKGNPFTTSSLLLLLRRLMVRDHLLVDRFLSSLFAPWPQGIGLPRPPDHSQITDSDMPKSIHPVLMEGIMVIVLEYLGMKSGELLPTLARLPEKFPALALRLEETKQKKLLLAWLMRFQDVLFSGENKEVWRMLCDCLGQWDRPFRLLTDANLLPPPKEGQLATGNHTFQQAALRMMPNATDEIMPEAFPKGWQKWVDATRELQDLHRRFGLGRLNAPEMLAQWQECTTRLDSFTLHLGLLSPMLKTWKEEWRKELQRLHSSHLPKEEVDYLVVESEELLTVPGEIAQATLRLCNHGPHNINNPVTFWIEGEALPDGVSVDGSVRVEARHLSSHAGSRPGESITLSLLINPPFTSSGSYRIKLGWSVGRREKRLEYTLHHKPRVDAYRLRYLERDGLIQSILTVRNDQRPRYQRVVVRRWRCREEEGSLLNRIELARTVKIWVERSRREETVSYFSTEPGWPNATHIPASRLGEQLKMVPHGLEFWFMEEAVPWNLHLLQTIAQAPATALFIPDLELDDPPTPHQTHMLDEMLAVKDPNGLAVLHWALKACIQGGVRVEAGRLPHPSPACLAMDLMTSSGEIRRGSQLDLTVFLATHKKPLWVAGVERNHPDTLLPADPVQPLSSLINIDHFALLLLLSLVKRWGDYWVPRFPGLFPYVDSIYPTGFRKSAKGADQLQDAWTLDGWSTTSLDLVQRILFGSRQSSPNKPAMEGFGIEQWGKLQQFTAKRHIHPLFFPLIGLKDLAEFRSIQTQKQKWWELLHGNYHYGPLISQQLGLAGYEVKDSQPISQNKDVTGLCYLLENKEKRGPFHSLFLLLPNQFSISLWEKSNSEGRLNLLNHFLQEAEGVTRTWISDNQTCQLLVMDGDPSLITAIHQVSPRTVFLDDRRLSRLMTTSTPRQALMEIIHSQIPLMEVVRSVFITEGPVPPNRFFGRKAILHSILEGLRQRASIIISGPRAIGKSSLLRKLPECSEWQQIMAKNFVPILADLQEQRSVANDKAFLEDLVAAAEKAALGFDATVHQRIGQLQWDPDSHAARKPNASDMTTHALTREIIHSICAQAQADGKNPIFFFDEVDGFYSHDKLRGGLLFTLFRRLHNDLQAGFVFASYPPQVEGMAKAIASVNTQGFNFVQRIQLGPMEMVDGITL